ncbi:hypothetical protein FB639_003618 [Coemansia asiatica]|nr:hypothetical protein FB639_003618 [Coemansia asiatica]
MADDKEFIPLRDFALSNQSTDTTQSTASDDNALFSMARTASPQTSADGSPGSESSSVLTPRRFRGSTITAHSTSTSKLSTLLDDSNRQQQSAIVAMGSSGGSAQRTRNNSDSITQQGQAVDNGSSTRAGSSFDSMLNDFSVEEEALDNQAIMDERAYRLQNEQQGGNVVARLLGFGGAAPEYQVLGDPQGGRRHSPSSEPIWSRRMLVLPMMMLVSMGLVALVISAIAWTRNRIEYPQVEVNSRLFPYLVDRAALSNTQYSLRLIHTNDMHAHFLPYDSNGDSCDPARPTNGTDRCVGGSAYVKAVVDHLQLADRVNGVANTILLNAGDEFEGTLYHVLFKGNVSADLLNAFHVDALSLGNHEFDLGPEHLARYLARVHAPALCANLEFPADTTDLSALQSALQPFTIIERHRVGIIGVLTPETMDSSMMGGVRVTDPVAAINLMKARLNKQGIHRIMVLSHMGYEADMDIARRVDSGISLIVGGHTHSYLNSSLGNNTLAPSDGKTSKGPYPTWVANSADSDWQTAVVQAKSLGEYVGYLDLVFNDDGSLDSKLTQGAPISVDAASPKSPVFGIKPNARINDILQPYVASAKEFSAHKIGRTTDEFPAPASNIDTRELALGNLVADALVWATRQHSSNGAVTLFGTGSMRRHLPKGEITRGDLLGALPFDDQMAAVSVPGLVLRHMVANTTDPNKITALSTMQVSGLRFTSASDVQVRVSVGNLDNRPMETEKWEPLDDTKSYELLAPMFLVRGGDRLIPRDMSKEARVVFESYRDWVELYITRFSPISPILDHRK